MNTKAAEEMATKELKEPKGTEERDTALFEIGPAATGSGGCFLPFLLRCVLSRLTPTKKPG
jgi:hypothetical protein